MKFELRIHFDNPLQLILDTGTPAALAQLNTKLDHIMSKISEFAARVAEHNDKIDAAVDGLKTDIEALVDKVDELQNSAGEVTAEDQASLDSIETRVASIAAKIEALDAERPPVAPTE